MALCKSYPEPRRVWKTMFVFNFPRLCLSTLAIGKESEHRCNDILQSNFLSFNLNKRKEDFSIEEPTLEIIKIVKT